MTNNLFNGLQVVSGEIKTNLLNESTDIEISFRGEVSITKGNFEQTFNYYCNRCEINKYGFIGIDDWDYDFMGTTLGGLPVDNIHKLKETLSNSGLTTLSNSLGFCDAEIRKEIFLAVENSKGFKEQFGKSAKVWRALDDAEQRVVKLNYAIDNYETCQNYDKSGFGIFKYDEEGELIGGYIPTIEELKELRESLT